MSIGIFDSGVGGLTVLKEVRNVLPNEKIIYLGDTARVPYGEKTKDLIVRYSKQIVEFLIEEKVDAIVVACNTATSLALDELNKTFKTPIIGVIGTKATINSKKYETEIKKRNHEIEVYSKSCPLFVPAIEEGIIKGKLINQMVQMYLDDFKDKIDSLILGCTHYPLLKETISSIYPNIKIVDPAKDTAQDLKEILIKENLLKNDAEKGHEVEYFVTDGQDKFKEIGIMFLNENIDHVNLIKL